MLFLAGGFPRKLHIVDRMTGIATEGVDLSSTIISLAYDGETLFGITGNTLYSVDLATGALARRGSVANFGRSETGASGIAWDGTNLFMAGDRFNRLYTLDRVTSRATTVANFNGLSGVRYGDMTWDGTTLFMLDESSNNRLLTVDRTSAELARVGDADDFGVGEADARGLGSDGEKLFMVGATLDALIDVDKMSSVGTVIGTAVQFGQSLSVPNCMAWVPPSTPAVVVPPILPPPQFEGYDEFTLYFDILRPPTNSPTMIAANVEMLVQTEIDSVLISDVASLEFALGTLIYTPRFPVEGVSSEDRIIPASDPPATAIPFGAPIIKGGRTVGDNFRQSFVVSSG